MWSLNGLIHISFLKHHHHLKLQKMSNEPHRVAELWSCTHFGTVLFTSRTQTFNSKNPNAVKMTTRSYQVPLAPFKALPLPSMTSRHKYLLWSTFFTSFLQSTPAPLCIWKISLALETDDFLPLNISNPAKTAFSNPFSTAFYSHKDKCPLLPSLISLTMPIC